MSCCIPCPPCCTIPSCASSPVVGLGPCGPTIGGGCGYGYGIGSGFGSGFGGYGGRGSGGVTSASSLGILSGVFPSCISQIPPSEVVIQPPSYVLTIPGPILSASCEPLSVGGYTPCSSGFGSYGYGSSQRYLGGHGRGICLPKCTPC